MPFSGEYVSSLEGKLLSLISSFLPKTNNLQNWGWKTLSDSNICLLVIPKMCLLSFLIISFYIRGRRDGKTVAPRKPVEKAVRETPWNTPTLKTDNLTANKWHPKKKKDFLSSKPINIFGYKLAVRVQPGVFQAIRLGPKTTEEEGVFVGFFGGCIWVLGGCVEDSWLQNSSNHTPLKTNISPENSWFEDEISS